MQWTLTENNTLKERTMTMSLKTLEDKKEYETENKNLRKQVYKLETKQKQQPTMGQLLK